MFLKGVVFSVALTWLYPCWGEPVRDVCETPSSYRDVLSCAVENYPEVRQSKLQLNQSQHLINIAEQRPNPELNSQFLGGKAGDDKYQYNQINLAHTVELGGKRNARIRKSRALASAAEIDLESTREKIYLKTYVSLVRLRQIVSELDIYDDVISTFEKIQKQYRARPRMNPEQQATYAIMDIAAHDYRLRRRRLVDEDRENDEFLLHALGRKLDRRAGLFPPSRKQWPVLTSPGDRQKSLRIKKSIADLEFAQSELAGAKSWAWPDLKLGPTFEIQSQGDRRSNAVGLNLTFLMPLFHTNQAGRSYAVTGVSRAEQLLAATQFHEDHQLELQRERYQDAVSALEATLSIADLHKKHQAVEKSFEAGVVPSSLVIEVHRQMVDFSRSLGEQEIVATEALANVYSIEGRLLSEGL